MKSKKILVISPDSSMKGGISSYVSKLNSINKNFEELKFYFLHTVVLGSKVKKFLQLIFIFPIFIIKAIACDYIFIHTATHFSWVRKSIFAFFALIIKKKFIIQIHGGNYFKYINESWVVNKKLTALLFKRAHAIVVLSDSHHEGALKMGAKNVFLINNFVNVDDYIFYPRKDWPRYSFGYVGLISEDKGIFELIEFAKILKSLKIKFKFNIVGDGPDRKNFESFVCESGFKDYFIFHGWVPYNEINSYMNDIDVLLLLSKFEAQPIAVIEAMLSGCVVVATPVGDIPRMLNYGKCGFIVKEGSVTDYTNVIKSLDNSKMEDIIFDARERAVELFSSDTFVNKISVLFSQ